jgi:hypothetical protein
LSTWVSTWVTCFVSVPPPLLIITSIVASASKKVCCRWVGHKHAKYMDAKMEVKGAEVRMEQCWHSFEPVAWDGHAWRQATSAWHASFGHPLTSRSSGC